MKKKRMKKRKRDKEKGIKKGRTESQNLQNPRSPGKTAASPEPCEEDMWCKGGDNVERT